jgi:hypothetical protein
MAGFQRGKGYARPINNPSERFRAQVMGNVAVTAHLDLAPLAKALRDMPGLVFDKQIAWALNRGIKKFRSDAHKMLKAYTKIKTPSDLKRGVRLIEANVNRQEASYVIRTRNLTITARRFGATSKASPRTAALIRWGKLPKASVSTKWTAWDGSRTRQAPFMFKKDGPVFVRLRKFAGGGGIGRKGDLQIVRGPNPAQLVRLHAPAFKRALEDAARDELVRQIKRSYEAAEKRVKAANRL